MKKFKFPLQSLLDYRIYLEKMAQTDVSKAQKDVMASEKRIRELNMTYDATSREFDREMAKGIPAARFMFFTEYFSGLEAQIEREEKNRQTYLSILKEKQSILKKKSIERKTIERLKEKQKNEYYDVMLKQMQKEMDDMVVIRQNKGPLNDKQVL